MAHPLDGDPDRELKLKLGYRENAWAEPTPVKRDIVERLELHFCDYDDDNLMTDAATEIKNLRDQITFLENTIEVLR